MQLELLYISLDHCPYCRSFSASEWPRLSTELVEIDHVGARNWNIDKFTKEGAREIAEAKQMYSFRTVPALFALVDGNVAGVWEHGENDRTAHNIMKWLAQVWCRPNLHRLLKRSNAIEDKRPTVLAVVNVEQDEGEAWTIAARLCREFHETLVYCARLIVVPDLIRVRGNGGPLLIMQDGNQRSFHQADDLDAAIEWVYRSTFMPDESKSATMKQ